MSKIVVNKTKDYTIMSNQHFKEKDMSLKAIGLLSLMLSLPENWDYSINGLVSIRKENETAIKSALNELKQFGYVRVDKIMPNKSQSGRIEYVYNIFQEPQKQGIEKQGIENLPLENQTQLNTNNKSTKDKDTNNIKENKKKDIFDDFNFTEKIKQSITKWLDYKKQKGQTYKEIGLNTLLKNINKGYLAYGEQVVLDSIDNCISNNYAGLFINKPNKVYTPKDKLIKQTYTQNEINSVFKDIDDINIEELNI